MRTILSTLVLAGSLFAVAAAEAVEVKYPGGKTKQKYAVDAEGRKSGPFVEYFENGKVRIRATCKDGEWHGPYASFHLIGKAHVSATYNRGKLSGPYSERSETGALRLTATYRDGQLQGLLKLSLNGQQTCVQEFKDGNPPLPRTLGEIQQALVSIYTIPKAEAKLDEATADRRGALRRLQAYRYLAGVPYENLQLDEDMNRHCDAAARICAAIGRLDHRPANPGWAEADYKFAYEGTSHANLYTGKKFTLATSVDTYMDDSNATNIARVGHRRWCLNPALQKTGFGKHGEFAAMWSFDKSQPTIPDYDFISYPAPGFVPISHFGPRHAWSVSLNPKKYMTPSASVKVKVYNKTDRTPDPLGSPVALDYTHVDTSGIGIRNCIIFRPGQVVLAEGQRYWVDIEGLKKTDGSPASLRFFVFFVAL